MLDPVSLARISGYKDVGISGDLGKEKVKQEFLAIFYREILKQAIKPPQIGYTESEEEKGSVLNTFSSDLLMEKLALELARSGAFSVDDVFGSGSEMR